MRVILSAFLPETGLGVPDLLALCVLSTQRPRIQGHTVPLELEWKMNLPRRSCNLVPLPGKRPNLTLSGNERKLLGTISSSLRLS